MKRQFTVAVVLVCLTVSAVADTLVTVDGKNFKGRLVSRDRSEVVFEVHKYGAKMTRSFPASQVKSVTEGDESEEAAEPEPEKPEKSPDGEGAEELALGELPPEPEAPPKAPQEGPTYYLIRLQGMIGRDIVPRVLRKSLADAVKRGPTAVVLEIDSDGGYVKGVEPLVDVVRDYSGKVRIVVYVKKAMSAAAITSFSAKEIYFAPSGLFGAATAYQLTPQGTGQAVEEKMQSVWRAVARSAAETGGHSPLLAAAMIDKRMDLHARKTEGKVVIEEGKGEKMITQKGRLLTLTAGEAEACGLSSGTVDGLDALGKQLGYSGWRQCEGYASVLNEHWKKTLEKFQADMKVLHEKYEHNMKRAADNYPWNFQYSVWSNGPRQGKFTPASKKRWRRRSGICWMFIRKAEKNCKDAAALLEKVPDLPEHVQAPDLREWRKHLTEARKKIRRNMNVSSPADIER